MPIAVGHSVRLFTLYLMQDISTTVEILEIAVNIYGAQRMIHNDFGDPLAFPLAHTYIN